MAIVFVLAGAAAAQAPAVNLTLDEAIARGLAASHQLAAAEAERKAADSSADGQAASRRPIVSAQAGYVRTNNITPFGIGVPGRGFVDIYPNVPDNYRTRLDLQWPIYTGGRADALERAARAEAGAAADAVATARADLRLEITRAFWALVTARDTVHVVEQAHRRMQAHLNDVRHAFDVGLLPPNDVSSAEAQEARQRMLLIQAQNQRETAAADLCRLVGLPADAAIEPSAELAPPPAPAPASTLAADARANRSERQALERQVAAAQARQAAAEAGRRPVVAIAGGVDYARPNPRIFPRESTWQDSWDAGVNVSWPLWDAGRTSSAIAAAAAGASAARERLADFDSRLDADVRERVLDLESSRAAITAAEAAVTSAAEATRVVHNRFEAGVATSTDVLDAQVAQLQAELDRTRAIAAARLAEARLKRTLGQ
jgi:outer membrane protein TolC